MGNRLTTQPFEVHDFSGGMTENYFDAGPTRYQFADNFFISVDNHLYERYGTIPFSDTNYILPGASRRVDGLFTFINDSKLLVQQGRDVSCLPEIANPTWTHIVGPSGNEALGAGGTYSVVTTGEFKRQLYLASDAQPIPSKIYIDENNAYAVRTAGLPRVQNVAINPTVLLAECISNANALRTSMLDHIADFDNGGAQTAPSATNLHWNVDVIAQTAILAVPVASDRTSLFNLVGQLCAAFGAHNTTGITTYHFISYYGFGPYQGFTVPLIQFGPLAPLTNSGVPNTLQEAANQLDDLYQKWFWHQLAVNLHGQGTVNNYALMNQYMVTNAKIGTVLYDPITDTYLKQPPSVAPNYQDFFNYVNGLIDLHNMHLGGGGGVQLSTYDPIISVFTNTRMHGQPDTFNDVTLPLVGTIDEAYLAIAWLRLLYFQHTTDFKDVTAADIDFLALAATPNLTNLYTHGTLVPYNINTLGFFTQKIKEYNAFGAVWVDVAGFESAAEVTAAASGSAVMNKNAQFTFNYRGIVSPSNFHFNYGLTPVAPAAQLLTTSEVLIGSDLISWEALAEEYMYCLMNHLMDTNLHHNLSATYTPNDNISLFNPINTPNVPQWFVPTVSTLSYAFTYFYEYTVEPNGVVFENESNPVFTDSIETIETFYPGYYVDPPVVAQGFWQKTKVYNAYPITITNIPTLTNDTITNYDTANIDVRIYRTTSGGNTYFLLDSVANGVNIYFDTTNGFVRTPGDTLLSTRQVIYTTGGVVGNDQPPQAKVMHIFNQTAYYGNIIDNGQFLPNRLVQGLPGQPDSAPGSFTDDFDDEIVGISSARSNVIVFCTKSIYRESGAFNSLGQGQLTHEKISDRIGCISAASIIRTEVGVFYAGTDGFYCTDGFQNIKISIDLNQTYAAFTKTANQRKRIRGAYDALNRRIWWTVQENPTDTECNKAFIFYLDYGIKPSGVFTTVSNDGSLVPAASNPLHYQYWRAGALTFFEGNLVRGDERGLLFKSDENTKTDPKIDLSIPATQWATVTIPYNYASSAGDYGTTAKRKWVTKINVTGLNIGNTSFDVISVSDNGRVVVPLSPVNYASNCWWGNPAFVWGASGFIWGASGQLDAWRRYPANARRANIRQIVIRPAFIGVYRSEDFPFGCTVTTDNVTKLAVIATPPTFTAVEWPADSVDYYLTLSSDNYVNEYLITAVAADTLTVADPNNTLPTLANQAWVLRGYRKNQRLDLDAYVIHFALLDEQTSSWASKADSGENT